MIIPQHETSLVIRCPICSCYYLQGELPISCCVAHPPGDCCHYGDKHIPNDLWDKFMLELKEAANAAE